MTPSDSEEDLVPRKKGTTTKAPLLRDTKGKVKAKSTPIATPDNGEDENENENGTPNDVRDAQGRRRKTRRVLRSVSSKNARGYTVTEDVSEEESYYSEWIS